MTSYLVALAINIVVMLAATVWMIRRHANQLQCVEMYTLRPLPGVPAMDILDALQNWSDRNLRWLIDYIARLNDQGGGQGTYTVILKRACALRDQRSCSEEKAADMHEPTGRFILAGIEGHEFGRCKTNTDCYELAARMGLGIVQRLDSNGYFGHATIQEVQ